ncbi:LysM peptidoglycan-binding domain-containing protein [Solemya velesiana gill symbiont]|nr:LysM peptidoglycan-binding domain-containing protein [Solemya velesiana gill symbiont]
MGCKRTALPLLAVLTLFGLSACNKFSLIKDNAAAAASPAPETDTAVQVAYTPEIQETVAPDLNQETSFNAAEPQLNQPPVDLWERIRKGFRMSTPGNPRIEREIKWYAKHPEHLVRIRDRAAPYLYFIVEEVEKRGMPTEMALLPAVESAFQPFAYSPGRAAGLWQFIPSTGKSYGLKQNWWYDGRRDVVAATGAALNYLKSMSRDFNGDWELALAGYNAGAGNVRSAIRRNQKSGKPTDYWSLKLPRETLSYVPRLLAISLIIANPKAFGLDLPEIENSPVFGSVDTDSQLDLALAADMADISIKELYRFNPGFNRWATDPDGPHRLNLPLDKVEAFKVKLAELSPEKRLTWKRYKIRSGDNLGAIARKHHTTVGLLQQINKLKNSRIRAGRHLLIPVSAQSLDQYAYSVEQRNKKLQNVERKGNKVMYTVRSGDNLWTIARRYGVNHKRLAKWNGIAPGDTLRLGQKLVIWTQKSVATTASPSIPSTVPFKTRSTVHYRVRSRDSLSRIAQRFNVKVSDLKKWNKLPGRYLQPGQSIKLYVDVTEQAAL